MTDSSPPIPTWLYRLVHVDTLSTLLNRGMLHAPNATPKDNLPYRTIHNTDVQENRHRRNLPCGPGGTLHDYVPFYFGNRSPMLLNLKTGQVTGYSEGQEPLVYLVTSVQTLQEARCAFVFSDGHGLATFTNWYDNLADLDKVDWDLVQAKYWKDLAEDNDRQRRKQAELLVWHHLDWPLIKNIGVLNSVMKTRVEGILDEYPNRNHPPVRLQSSWYY